MRGLPILLLVATGAVPLSAQQIGLERVASGLARPLFATAPAGDARLFLVEQDTARIRILKGGQVLPAPFLDLGALASSGGERGLLGLAFHPDYAGNGFFYVNYTDNGGDTVVARYSVSAANPDLADPASALVILQVNQPFSNHNGGMIAFGPQDGFLYIGMGDGGAAGDPGNRAQNGLNLLGKMLRIDVDGGPPYGIPSGNPFVGDPNVRDEIWALGLRNPWRFAFDRAQGDLYIGDVGQNLWEEVDFQPGSSPGGENYGWRFQEGTHCFNPPSNCDPGGLTDPVHEYGHGGNPFRCSVTGGVIYRGGAIPGLQGTYFFADYCSNQVWSFRMQGGAVVDFRERTAELQPGGGLDLRSITSFGEDAAGEIYLCDQDGGELFQVVPRLMGLQVAPLQAGQTGTATASGAPPGAAVFLAWSALGPGLTPVAALDVVLGLAAPHLAASATADPGGSAVFSATVPPAAAGRRLWFQAATAGNTSIVAVQQLP